MHRVMHSKSREEATEMGLFDQFKDLFYTDKKADFLNGLYDLVHDDGRSGEGKDFSAIARIIARASAEDLEEFYTGRNASGKPILHVALEEGQLDVIAAYKLFLGFLPDDQRDKFLVNLLAAKDRDGNSGLTAALKNDRGDAIGAYRSLLDLLSPAERAQYCEKLLAAEDQHGIPGLVWAMGRKSENARSAYRILLEEFAEKKVHKRLNDLLTLLDFTTSPSLDNKNKQRADRSLTFEKPDDINVFHKMLDLVPADHLSKLLIYPSPLVLKNKDGDTGLCMAMKRGDVAVINAYKTVLARIPEQQRDSKLARLLAGADRHGTPCLCYAMQNGNADAIAAYGELLALLPPVLRSKYLVSLLEAKDQDETPALARALKNGHAAAITAFKECVKLLPPDLLNKHLVALLEAKDANGDPALARAMQRGHAEAISAFKGLVELLPLELRIRHLPNLLDASDINGQPALYLAMKYGNARAIIAFKGLVDLLPEQLRNAHLLGLLSAKDRKGIPALTIAMDNGNAACVTAYKELLGMLSEQERRQHLGVLLVGLQTHDDMPALFRGLLAGVADTVTAYLGLMDLIPEGCHGAIFKDIFSDAPNCKRSAYFDKEAFFNHLDNASHCSLLTCIDKIDSRHSDLRNELMAKWIGLFENFGSITAGQASSIIAICTSRSQYAENPVISHFIGTRLISPFISAGNTGKLMIGGRQLPLLINAVHNIVLGEQGGFLSSRPGTFMLENNGFFVQLIALCTNHPDPRTRNRAETLYDRYLSLPELQPHKAQLAIFGFEQGIRASGDSPQDRILNDDAAYLFARRHPNRRTYDGLLLSKDDIDGMLATDKIHNWSNVAFITEITDRNGQKEVRTVTNGAFSANDIYPQFDLFRTTFQLQYRQSGLLKLLNTLGLNYTNTEQDTSVRTRDYTKDFLDAFQARTSQTKLTTPTHKLTLHKIFGRLLANSSGDAWSLQSLPKLTDDHVRQILEIYRTPGSPRNTLNDARILFCLSAVFARLSSSSYFGQEYDSPDAIRVYAAALLNKARELNPAVCSGTTINSSLEKMLGLNGAFTCTAVLSGEMMAHAKSEPAFKQVLMAIKPMAWS